jgi:hypothetical protein
MENERLHSLANDSRVLRSSLGREDCLVIKLSDIMLVGIFLILLIAAISDDVSL